MKRKNNMKNYKRLRKIKRFYLNIFLYMNNNFWFLFYLFCKKKHFIKEDQSLKDSIYNGGFLFAKKHGWGKFVWGK